MPDSNVPLLQVDDLVVSFPVRRGFLQRTVGEVRAVNSVSFTVDRGKTLGIVGESGCGKSTTARAILRLVAPTSGSIRFDGEEILTLKGKDLLRARRQLQMVFQDPFASLNPRMTVFETLEEPFILHENLSKAERKERVSALLDKVGLSSAFGNRFPHEFSGGQRQRVGIARAIALNPKLVVLDEPVSALDVSVQAQILNLLQELQAELGLTYVFVAHDLAVVRHACEDIVVMYLGKVVERAPTEELFKTPQHPYTKALLSAVSEPDPIRERARKRIVLQGEVPSPLNPPSGCSFRTRCPLASARCAEEAPQLKGDPKRQVACHHVKGEP